MKGKQLLLRVLKKAKVLSYVNLILKLRVNGTKFKIPVFHEVGFSLFFLTETWMPALLKKLLAIKGGVFIDVGINLGQTMLILKSIDRQISYIGFEPNPKCVYYVEELVQCNWPGQMRIIPAGIFSFDGIATLYLDKKDKVDSCATLLEKFRDTSGQDSVTAPVISKNSLGFLLEKEISIIKIDVEGTELEVLEQLSECVRKFRPFILCEILPTYSHINNYRLDRQRKIESLLHDWDYKISYTGNEITKLDLIPVDSDEDHCNYLFFPAEMQKLL